MCKTSCQVLHNGELIRGVEGAGSKLRIGGAELEAAGPGTALRACHTARLKICGNATFRCDAQLFRYGMACTCSGLCTPYEQTL